MAKDTTHEFEARSTPSFQLLIRIAVWVFLIGAASVLVQTQGMIDVRKLWVMWGSKVAEFGPIDGWRAIHDDYPPLTSLQLGAATKLGEMTGTPQILAIKISIILTWICSCVVFGLVVRKYWMSVIFASATLFYSNGYGYLDLNYTPFLICALAAWMNDRFRLFWFLYVGACLFKWQPAILGPFFVISAFQRHFAAPGSNLVSLKNLAAEILPGALLFVLPWGIWGPDAMLSSLTTTLGMSKHLLSPQGLNMNWLLSGVVETTLPGVYGTLSDGQIQIAKIPNQALKLAHSLPFLAMFGLALFRAWIAKPRACETLVWAFTGFLTYFMFSTGVHENHLYVPMLLAIFLFATGRIEREPMLWMVAALNVNLLAFYGPGTQKGLPRALGGWLDITWILAATNLALYFAWAIPVLKTRERVERSSVCPAPA